MGFLEKVIDEIIDERVELKSMQTARFTVVISSIDNVRLEFISKKLGINKTEFVRKVVMAGVADVEARFNLLPTDFENLTDSQKEYIKEMSKEGFSKETLIITSLEQEDGE